MSCLLYLHFISFCTVKTSWVDLVYLSIGASLWLFCPTHYFQLRCIIRDNLPHCVNNVQNQFCFCFMMMSDFFEIFNMEFHKKNMRLFYLMFLCFSLFLNVQCSKFFYVNFSMFIFSIWLLNCCYCWTFSLIYLRFLFFEKWFSFQLNMLSRLRNSWVGNI